MLPSEFIAQMKSGGYSEEEIGVLLDAVAFQTEKHILSMGFILQDAFDMVRERGYDYAKDMLTPKREGK